MLAVHGFLALTRITYALLRQPGTTLAGWLWPIAFGFSKHTHISSMLVLVPFCPQLPWGMLLYSSTFIHHGTFLHFMAVKTGIWLFFLYQYLPSNDERYHFMCLYDSFCRLDIPIASFDTSAIGGARDMPGSASWPGKTPSCFGIAFCFRSWKRRRTNINRTPYTYRSKSEPIAWFNEQRQVHFAMTISCCKEYFVASSLDLRVDCAVGSWSL